MMLDKMIKRLTKELEMDEGSLATETPGIYRFPVDERVTVTISEIPRGFSFSCTLAESPKINQEEFYTRVMIANLFGRETSGGILGMDGTGNLVKLSMDVDYISDYQEFVDLLEDFMNSADFWSHETVAYGS